MIADVTKADLLRELFVDQVIISNGRFGLSATWQNTVHPNNADFMQPVLWTARENGDHSQVVFQYQLSAQTAPKVFSREPLTDFNKQVFEFWQSQF